MLEMVQQRYAEVGAISATFEIIAFIAVLSLILFLVLAALFARNKELSGQMSRNAMYSLAVAGVALFLGSTAASGILPFLAAFAGVLLVFFVFTGINPNITTPWDGLGPVVKNALVKFFGPLIPKRKGKKGKKGKNRIRQVSVDDLLD